MSSIRLDMWQAIGRGVKFAAERSVSLVACCAGKLSAGAPIAALLALPLLATPAQAQILASSTSATTGVPGETSTVTISFVADFSNTLSDVAFTLDLDDGLSGSTIVDSSVAFSFGCVTPDYGGSSFVTFQDIDVSPFTSCQIDFDITIPADTAFGTYTFSPSDLTGTGSSSGGFVHDLPDFDVEVAASADTTAPNTSITGPSGIVSGDFNINISWFEGAGASTEPDQIDGFELTDLVVTNATVAFASGGDETPTGNDISSINLVVTPTGGTPITVFLPADSVTDEGGNGNVASNTLSVDYDVDGDPADDVDFSMAFLSNPIDAGDTVTARFSITNNSSDALTAGSFDLDIDAASTAAFTGIPPITTPCGAGSSATFGGSNRYVLFTGLELAAGASCTFDLSILADAGLSDGTYGFSTGSLSYQLDGSAVSDTNAAAQLTISHDEGVSGIIQFTKTFSEDEVDAGDTIDLEFYIALTGDFTASGMSFTDDLDAMLSGAVATGLPATNICGTGSSISGTSSLTFTGGSLASGASCTFSVTVQVPGGAGGGTYNNTTSTLAATRSDDGAVTVDAATDSFDVSTVGGTPPTTTISGETTDLGVGVSRSLSVRFSEAIDLIEIADFDITNATVSDLTGADSEWTLTLSPDATGAVSVQLQASVAQDAEGDFNQVSNLFSFTAVTPVPEIDITGNSVTIVDGDSLPVATDHTLFPSADVSGGTSSRTFTIENEGTGPLTVSGVAITGTNSADFTVSTSPAGTVAAGGSTTFTITFDPSATGSRVATVTVTNNDSDESTYEFAIQGSGSSAPEIVVADATGVTNIPHQDGSPSVAKGSDFGAVVTDGGTVSSTFLISNTGSAALTLGSNAVSLTGSSDFTVTAQPATTVAASGSTTFTIEFDPSSAGDATATVSIANDDSDESPFTFQVTGEGTDTTPPSGQTVAFDSTLYGPPTYTSASFTIDDPEVRSDYSWSISSSGGGTPVTGSGTIPTPDAGDPSELQITGVDLSGLSHGTLTVSVVLTDENGNAAAAVTGTATLDLEGPDVTISTGSPDPVSGAFTATFTFTEDVTGFLVGDITVGNGAASAFSATSGSVYTATITPAADGTVTIDVPLDAADDAAGNGSNAATQFTIENDETAPTLTISTVSSDPVSGAFTAAFLFSEDVTGFTVGDISVGNGSASGFVGSGDTYSATITPAGDGTVTVDVAGAAAQDDAGNDNTAATQFSIENDETVPTVAITSGASDPVSGAFSVTFTFSEDVTGFAVGDISVGNGAASAFAVTSATVYTATITPAADGTVTVDVAADSADDDAGNGNTAATQFSIENDETAPTVVISTGSSDPVSGAFTATFTFSEDVTGFALGDISVGNGAASAFAVTSATVYTATITPAADGSVTVDVAADAADDDAGNGNTAATQFSIENDETAPTVAISTGSSDPVSGAFTATFTFSEDVTGFAVGDISVGNGSASAFAGSGDTYTATITPAADGTVTVDVASSVAQDDAGNDNTAATQFSIENDETVPTVAISSGASDPVSGAFSVTFTFSEDVTGFAVGDISVGNGAASAFAGSGDTYTATITPAADGTVTVDVAGSVAQDDAGNDNTAATQFSIENDETGPTVAISTGSSDPVSGAFTATFTFSEDVTGFAVGDISVGNGAASAFSATSATIYTATITPAADGTVTVDVAAGAAQDDAGNDNTAATQFSIENDETAPTVAISTGSSDPVSGAFTATFTFSEDVTGFAVGDISVGNGAASAFAGSGDTYTATITPAADGTVTVDVAGSVAQDSAGNDNTAATQFSIENDETVPTLVISNASVDPISGAFTATFTFSEDVTGFAVGDISVGNGAASAFSATSATIYTATITPAADGTVTIDVAAGVAQDAAGNDNTAATQFSVENDETLPSVSITTGSSDPVSGAFTATFTFSEDVTGFAVGDISVGNGAASAFSATSGTVYTATITPAADGTVTVDVAAGVAQDDAGNDNTAAVQLSIENDETAPTVAISTGSSDPVSGAFTATFTFSEDVTGFAVGDISVGNGAASVFAGSGDTYTATITPAADGTVTVDVAGSVAQDGAGNDNTAATQFSIENDETVPTVAISSAASDPVSGAFSVTFTFSEDVTGFAGGDISVGNGAASAFSATSATVYTATITPSADGTVTVGVAADAAQDDAGNGNTAATQFSIENDQSAPSVTISSGSPDPVSGVFAVTFTFSEDVTGFAIGDISVGNGAASNFAGSGDTYTADITPVADGSVTVDVATGAAQDDAGNDNTAATQFSIENDETAPTVAVSTGSSDPVSGQFAVTFTFSEDVTGFAVGDITVGNGAASNFAGSGDTYTADITPAADGSVTVDVAAGVAQDDAGNDNTAATQFSIENDETVPSVAITTAAGDPVSGAFSVTFTFSEDVTGFAVGDISVGNGSASSFAGSGDTYTADITPAADGTVTVDVAADAAEDDAGNGNSAATQFSIENDESGPSVTIATGSPDPVSGVFAVTFTFSEDVTGFAVGNISVGNGSASNFAGSGDTYTADIIPAADGSVTVDVAAGVAQDDAGNDNTAATQFSIENDETAPTVAITTTDAEPVSGAFTVTVTFSEDVTGFAVGDITAGNATASDLAGSGSVYTATITPTATGTVTVDVAAGVAQDDAGNDNTAATQFTLDADLTAPTLAISGPSSVQMDAFTVTFTFSEDVTGFALADITVGNGSASDFAGSGDSYTATITPAADGTVTVDVAAGVAQDDAGNDNTAATQFSVDADLTAPGVTIATGSSDPVSGAFTVTFTFTEDVTGFAVGDITVGNGAASGFAGSGDSYSATITPAADGAVTVDVAAGVAQDVAGNDNTAATQFSIENDETAPTVAIAGPSDVQIGAFTVTFTFSEDVTGFALADIAVGNGAASDLAGSGAEYTATITPAATGEVTVDVAAGVVQDDAANDNTAATQFAVDADLSVPTLDDLVVSDADLRVEDAGGSFTVTATFSEAMDPAQAPSFAFETDLSATLSLDSGAFSSGDTVYTATYSIADGGQVASDIDITVSGAADAAGNPIADSTVADLFSVEMRRGSISVAVGITGAVDGTFGFTGDLGDFSVITASQAGSQDFTDLAEGDYAFTAAEVDGFTLDAISCSGGTAVTDASTGAVTVTLGPTDTVMCTFTQVAEPDVDETEIPEVTIELPTLSDDPTSETTSFSLDNVGGEAFYFNASTDQPWLVIDPTSGSIPATGSLEFTVSFTAAVLDLDPGTYTATITITEVDPPSQRGGARKANTLETINIPVTVTLEPRLGDLTLVVNTTMPEEGEGQFSYASSLAGFDGVTLQTVGGTARASISDVLRGTYTITQQDVEGWDLASIACTGDTDGGNTIDLANGVVTIDLDPEEDMVCTFTNRRNEEFIRAITVSAIRNFMATRADLILTNSPRLAGRMRGNRTNATPNRFVADYADGRFRAQMSTSLSALRQAAEETQPQQPGAERFSLQGRTGLSSLDVWVQASLSSVSDNRAGLGSEADFAVYHIGTDVMLNETTLVGVMLQYDQTEMVTGDWNSAVEGDGWMVGPYMVTRFGENTYFDVRALWGTSENSINPIGTYTDEFETDRWMVEMNLAGDILMGAWRVTPGIGLAYFTEQQDAYRDSLNFLIPSQRITIGRLSMGPEIAYRIENADGSYFEPYINLSALYDYDDADVINAAGQLQTLGHLRGDARLGLTAELANGGRITGEITLIGLGEGEFEANNAMLRIRLPLSME